MHKKSIIWVAVILVLAVGVGVVFLGKSSLQKGALIPTQLKINGCAQQWTEIFSLMGSPVGAPAILSGNFETVVGAVKNGCDLKVVAIAPEAQTISFECTRAEIFHELPTDIYKGFRCYKAGHVEDDSLDGTIKETLESIFFEYAKNIPGERITYSTSNYYGDGQAHTIRHR